MWGLQIPQGQGTSKTLIENADHSEQIGNAIAHAVGVSSSQISQYVDGEVPDDNGDFSSLRRVWPNSGNCIHLKNNPVTIVTARRRSSRVYFVVLNYIISVLIY